MLARYSKWKVGYLIKLFFQAIAGNLYFRHNFKVNNLKGGDYLSQVIAYADTLTLDGRINTIVSGTSDNRLKFIEYLDLQEKKGTLYYGHFVSTESIMTCYIENMNHKHTHFVDGLGGGYTQAAKQLKPKLQKAKNVHEWSWDFFYRNTKKRFIKWFDEIASLKTRYPC